MPSRQVNLAALSTWFWLQSLKATWVRDYMVKSSTMARKSFGIQPMCGRAVPEWRPWKGKKPWAVIVWSFGSGPWIALETTRSEIPAKESWTQAVECARKREVCCNQQNWKDSYLSRWYQAWSSRIWGLLCWILVLLRSSVPHYADSSFGMVMQILCRCRLEMCSMF